MTRNTLEIIFYTFAVYFFCMVIVEIYYLGHEAGHICERDYLDRLGARIKKEPVILKGGFKSDIAEPGDSPEGAA